jgi:hypothetical protein
VVVTPDILGFPYCYGVFRAYFFTHAPFQGIAVISVGGMLANVMILLIQSLLVFSPTTGRAPNLAALHHLLSQQLPDAAQECHVAWLSHLRCRPYRWRFLDDCKPTVKPPLKD